MIELTNLTKLYGDLIAVDHLTCQIEDGLLYGLLGVNGAGKTTTMNMIAGCLAPTEGEIVIGGDHLFQNPTAAKRRIGYLPEHPPLYGELTVSEYLSFVADAKKISPKTKKKEITRVMEMVNIASLSHKLIRDLSKGYRQRVGIAQAILGDPEIIILDEPTASLDPRQIVEIRKLIRSLKGKHTILLSSHILSEVAELCDKILILSGGKLVAMDTLTHLQEQYLHTDTLHLTARTSPVRCEEILKRVRGAKKITYRSEGALTHATLELPKGVDLREAIFFAFSEARCPILSMQLHEASLEEVFLTATHAPAKSLPSFQKTPVGQKKSAAPKTKSPVPAPPKQAPAPVIEDEDDDYKPLFGKKEN